MKRLELAPFAVKYGELLVTDPCYTEEYCFTRIPNAANGDWYGQAFTDAGYYQPQFQQVHALRVALKDAAIDWGNNDVFPREYVGDAGVDSGNLGIFASHSYPIAPEPFHRDFSRACFAVTEATGAGTLKDVGVVSSSGEGDGSYPVTIIRNSAGQVVAVEVVFISDEEQDEDENDNIDY